MALFSKVEITKPIGNIVEWQNTYFRGTVTAGPAGFSSGYMVYDIYVNGIKLKQVREYISGSTAGRTSSFGNYFMPTGVEDTTVQVKFVNEPESNIITIPSSEITLSKFSPELLGLYGTQNWDPISGKPSAYVQFGLNGAVTKEVFDNYFTLEKLEIFELGVQAPISTVTSPVIGSNYEVENSVYRQSCYSVVTFKHTDGRIMQNVGIGPNVVYTDGEEAKVVSVDPFIDSKGISVNKFPRFDFAEGQRFDVNAVFQLRPAKYSTVILDNPDHYFESYSAQFWINDDNTKNLGSFDVSNYGNGNTAPSINTQIWAQDPLKEGDVIYFKDQDDETIKTYPTVLTEVAELAPERMIVKSMPPIDSNKHTWTYELSPEVDFIESSDSFIPMVSDGMSSSSNIGTMIAMDGFKVSYLIQYQQAFYDINDFQPVIGFTIGDRASVWYTEADIVARIGTNNSGYSVTVYPLHLTHEEKTEIDASGVPSIGGNVTLSAVDSGFSTVNRGIQRYQWFKNGVAIPGKIGRTLKFTNMSAEDTGAYTVVSTAYPASMYADDSLIHVTSEAFNVNLGELIQVTSTLTGPSTIEVGTNFTLTGKVTSTNTGSITGIKLKKDGGEIQSFDVTELNPTFTKEAVSSDAGVYILVVEYTEGTSKSIESTPLVLSMVGDQEINATLEVRGAAYAKEGDPITFTAVVVASVDQPSISYQWYRNNTILSGKTSNILTIASLESPTDDGEYHFIASISAPGYMSTVKVSPKHNFHVLSNIHLVASVSTTTPVVADGKPCTLNVAFSADVDPNPTWEWYYNGTIIQGQNNKATINHTANGDATYYVKARPSASVGIPSEVQSNSIVVRGVVAVESLVLRIDGPSDVKIENEGSRFTMTADLSSTPLPPGSNTLNLSDYRFVWFKDGIDIGQGPTISLPVNSNSGGRYYFIVHSRIDDKITRRSETHAVTLDGVLPPEPTGIKYIHDLMPGRDRGYIWMGWWVHDEITQALIEGFNWRADPENARFKYKIDLKTLAYGLNHWPNLEMQESRNGYILTKRDVIV